MHKPTTECVGFADSNYTLLRDLHLDYFDEYEGFVDVTVPKGYRLRIELYSRWFLTICPPSEYLKILIVYEYICTHPEYERKLGFNFYKYEADQLFIDGLRALGAPKWKQWICYCWIKIAHGMWDKFREEE